MTALQTRSHFHLSLEIAYIPTSGFALSLWLVMSLDSGHTQKLSSTTALQTYSHVNT